LDTSRTPQKAIKPLRTVLCGDIVDCSYSWAVRRMDEKRYYDEKEETKQVPLVCAHCRQENTYPVRYIVRTKKVQIPPGGNEEDRAKFAKARSYMVRVDNMVACRNIRCRKRFELTGQSVFLI
jgi:hypothetical protein